MDSGERYKAPGPSCFNMFMEQGKTVGNYSRELGGQHMILGGSGVLLQMFKDNG